ncbi:MAG: alpha/beta hydrolase [Candidatus Hydrogenedentes bacterium]|nr:alpha/beta hydrolase [Candidatus Hydrogenedentota bacterium]
MNLMLAFILCAAGGRGASAHISGAERAEKTATCPRAETVVLLHGMGRSRASLWPLAKRLRMAGYETINFPYVPRSHSVREVSGKLHTFVEERVQTATYHFVGHSLGNIVVRDGFHRPYRAGLGRIVMLAPPNHPPALADRLQGNPLYRLVNGKCGQELASPAFYETLPTPTAPFGVIAGDRGQRITFDEPSDGIVAVESTRLEGMTDWILVHRSHTFIMNGAATAELCVRFLRTGSFALEE